jgi:DNA-binding response OmpR family regulator
MNVLVLAADEGLRLAVGKLLAPRKHVMLWAGTHVGAIRLLRTERVDCILLDRQVDLAARAEGLPIVVMRAPLDLHLTGHTIDAIARMYEETKP